MNQRITGYYTWGNERHRPLFCRRRAFLSLAMVVSLLGAAFFSAPVCTFAQEGMEPINEVRITTGTGRVIGGNVAQARNEAISQAFSTAVEEYLVQRLGQRVVANNFQRLYEEILSKPRDQIQDYQVVTEFTTDKYVRMLIKARVNTEVLGAILEDMGMRERDELQIAVLFLVAEKRSGSSASGWWTDPSAHTSLTLTDIFLSRAFEDRGFRVINRSFFPPEEGYDEGMLQTSMGDEDAVKWGKLLSAQVVITGESTITDESRASVYLKAIRVADGKPIAQGFRVGKPMDSPAEKQRAIESAVTAWADDMLSYIVDAFKPGEAPENQIIITVRGLRNYKELHDIKDFFLSNFSEITSVIERRLQREFVRVSLTFQGDSRVLARRVLNHPEKPFLFDIREVTDRGFTVVRR